MEQLESISELKLGTVKLSIEAPAVLLASVPGPITDQVVEWLMVALGDAGSSGGGPPLWKLSVITAACAHFYFTWEQAVEVRILFLHCTQPVADQDTISLGRTFTAD